VLVLVVKSLEGKYGCCVSLISQRYYHFKIWNVHPHYLYATSPLLWLVIKKSFISISFPPLLLYDQDFFTLWPPWLQYSLCYQLIIICL
jgi:hypothetical protein